MLETEELDITSTSISELLNTIGISALPYKQIANSIKSIQQWFANFRQRHYKSMILEKREGNRVDTTLA